jgi:plastocyanin
MNMKPKRGLIALAALLAVPAMAQAQGTVTEIATSDNEFAPENVAGDVGVQSIHWAWSTVNEHNVLEENELFDSGSPETTGDFTITPSAGTFNYYCVLHGFISSTGNPSGMAGRIAVRPTATPQGKRTLITWATEATDTGNRYDVRLKTGSKDAELVEENTKAIEAAFRLKRGKGYTFQVRSRKGKSASDWSPKLKVKG